MKIALPLIAASAAFAFVAAPVLADEPKQDTTEQETGETATAAADDSAVEVPAVAAPQPEPTPSAQTAEEEERICRSIRVDASSRRKTRVCLTQEGWRELNQRR